MALNGIPDNLGAAARDYVRELERIIAAQQRDIDRLLSLAGAK